MPAPPHPHAFYLQLPAHHRAPPVNNNDDDSSSSLAGLPYATIAAHRKCLSVWRLVESLEIHAGLFCEAETEVRTGDDGRDEDDDDEEEPRTMLALIKACTRLHTQLSSVYNLKHPGFTQYEHCQILLKVLTLLSATIEVTATDDEEEEVVVAKGVENMTIDDGSNNNNGGKKKKKKQHRVSVYYDDMGCIIGEGSFTNEEEEDGMLTVLEDGRRVIDLHQRNEKSIGNSNGDIDSHLGNGVPTDNTQQQQQLERDLSRQLALPSPAREALLSVALLLLSKKDQLRSVSNTAIFLDNDNDDGKNNNSQRYMLILNWRSLLRMLLRTAPYLDEHKTGVSPPKNSNTRTITVLKRTVHLIRACRKFFDQGIRPPNYNGTYTSRTDDTARCLWKNLQSDLMYHSHSNSCFRALIMMYLFHPGKCSTEYYEEVMPLWLQCWRNVDRCPEYDYLWMVLFCRGRKYVDNSRKQEVDNIWGELRKHLLTQAGYWLQIPVGGVSADKTFPRVGRAAKRSFPRNLKSFVGSESKYEEGIEFVAKLSKLFMYCSGLPSNSFDVSMDSNNSESKATLISEGTRDILRFFSFVKPYFNPSNVGNWTFPLGAFLHYLSYELCHRIGIMAAMKVLRTDHPDQAKQLMIDEPYLNNIELPGNEIVAYLDTLLPLCQASLYSKNGTVSHAGETAMLYLSQIDPARVTPPMLDFSLQALGISSVNLSHQAPAALSALSRLLQPALRHRPAVVLTRLPEMLQLTLAGIDSNDQNKTTRTLIFYRNLLMWIPCGGKITVPRVDQDGVLDPSGSSGVIEVGKNLMGSRYGIVSSTSYQNAIKALPPSSVFNQSGEQLAAVEDSEDLETLLNDAMMAMNDWSLSFLDRVFELLRAAGEQEKRGKGYAAAHTAADVAMTKNVSRILKETLTYFFASMDQETYKTSLRYVTNFISQETLPFAVKDASLLCQAVASTRFGRIGDTVVDVSPGLDALVPILTQDLLHRSNKSAIYRLRCLAGAVRYGGRTVLKHKEAILSALTYSIGKSDDKELLKTGCKLLRHTLASQCEEYPISQWCHPMRLDDESITVGASARLNGDRVPWCSPSREQIEFCVNLLDRFALAPMKEIGTSNDFNLQQWRKNLRVLRYSLRGSIGLLLDEAPGVILSQEQSEICPREKATAAMFQIRSIESASILNGLRQKLCLFVMDMQSLIVTDTVEDGKMQNGLLLSRDPKICSEVCQLADLLLTRRGAQHKSGSALSIWKGQNEIMCDYVLDSESNYIAKTRSRSNDNACQGSDESLYFDGEDGGNTISRALLLSRIHLTMTSLADAASTQIPRRLRKERGPASMDAKVHLFSLGMTYETLKSNLLCEIDGSTYQRTLEIYEGLIDGLCAMACHTNMNVRGNAISIAEYAFTRYAWVIRPRIPRLLRAFSLQDEGDDAKYGIVSCAQLVDEFNGQGKRMRLAEAIKGVIKLLGAPKVISGVLQTEANRFEIAQRLCTTQRLQSLLPHEELAKFTHYVTTIFLSIRSRHYSLPRATLTDQAEHEKLLKFLLDSLDSPDNMNMKLNNSEHSSSDVVESAKEDNDSADIHWKNRLMVAWLLTNSIDEIDLMIDDTTIMSRVWLTCLKLIEDEVGQPIQRISVGLLGRLVSLALVDMSQAGNASMKIPDVSILRNAFIQEKFCRNFATALAYDHKEDSSVGGGHSAQWSSGVEEILRDAANNLAPKSLYPFQRINQMTSSTFNIKHCQMVEGILLTIGWESANTSSIALLTYGKEFVAAPPNEDQRNKLFASAELFGGICRALLRYNRDLDHISVWNDLLLPFLDEAIQKMPNAFVPVLFDAIRFGVHHFPPRLFLPLLQWCVSKVQGTLWQHEDGKEDIEENGKQSDRFSLQSTYLLLVQAVLIELDSDDEIAAICRNPWYTNILHDNEQANPERMDLLDGATVEVELGQSWKFVSESLIPYLLNAIGHPYEKCRDQIASCLFRLCYCHGKFLNKSTSQGDGNELIDPGVEILKKLSTIRLSGQFQFKEKIRALGTARKFVSCCVHWGDSKHEFSQYLIPLLPLAFESLQPMKGEVSPENRGMEAELVKGYRLNLANMSTNCIVTYGSPEDMTRVLSTLTATSKHSCWQIRQATAHFLQCFQGSHKFLLSDKQEEICMNIAVSLLADDRREVSSAAMSILTGIIAILSEEAVSNLVSKYINIANKSLKKKKRKTDKIPDLKQESELAMSKERERAINQQKSVFFLCAVVMCRPYDVPSYVPEALAALSKHSFEQRASLGVREVVKMCCSEFKRTHTDDWLSHKKQFTQAQLEALEDVVSTPHYYA